MFYCNYQFNSLKKLSLMLSLFFMILLIFLLQILIVLLKI